jgi:ketosteroid isomerase-like protein
MPGMTGRDAARRVLGTLVDSYNRKDLEAMSRLYADDIRLWSTLSGEGQGKDYALAHVRRLFEILPDERMTAAVVVTDGQTVVVELTSVGTGADGRPYRFSFTEVIELDGDRIAAIHTYIDPASVSAITG